MRTPSTTGIADPDVDSDDADRTRSGRRFAVGGAPCRVSTVGTVSFRRSITEPNSAIEILTIAEPNSAIEILTIAEPNSAIEILSTGNLRL